MKERKRIWPLVLAIALNGAILVALFWSFHMNVPSSTGDTPMLAQLSSGLPPVAAPAPQPAPMPRPAPKPVPKPKPSAPPPPSAAQMAAEKAAQEKAAEQKAAQITAEKQAAEKRAEELAARVAHEKAAQRAAAKAAAKKAAAQKAAAEKAAAEKQAAQKAAAAQRAAALKRQIAEQQAKAAEAARAKALQQQMEAGAKRQAEANMAAALAKQAAENQRMLGMLINTIKTQVSEKWSTNFSPALSCVLQIHLGPQGQLLGAPVVVRSSGNPNFDRSVIAAVEAAAPFVPPIGLAYSTFNQPIDLKMNAEDLNHG